MTRDRYPPKSPKNGYPERQSLVYESLVAGAAAFGTLLTSGGPAAAKSEPREAMPEARHGVQPPYAGERNYPHYGHGFSLT